MDFKAKITGVGSAFPKTKVTNKDISDFIVEYGEHTDDQWIRDRTGIISRRISEKGNPDEYNSALGTKASLLALEMAGKKAMDVELIIYATASPDTQLPSTACWLQNNIGADLAWGFDLNAACSGFVYGLTVGSQFIQTGSVRTVLVVGVDVVSSLVNWTDRNSCILFGDGAGAAILERADDNTSGKIIDYRMLSNGKQWSLFHVEAGGSKLQITNDLILQNKNKMSMNGKEIFKVAVRTLADFALKILEKNNYTIDDLDWFVPHQANMRIIEAVARRIKIPMDRVVVNVERCGNTSAATIPTALDEAVRDNRIKKGQLVLLGAFGAGITFGSVLIRW